MAAAKAKAGGSGVAAINKRLYYGDNLDVMRQMPDGFVDLTYLDPPFKSDLDYNVLFTEDGISPDEAQMTVFKDTWLWDQGAQRAFENIQDIPNPRLVNRKRCSAAIVPD